MKIVLTLLTLLLSTILMCQQRTVYLSDILEEAIFSGREKVIYQDVELSLDNIPEVKNLSYGYPYQYRSTASYLKSKYPSIALDSIGRVIVPSSVELISYLGELPLDSLVFEKGLIVTNSEDKLLEPSDVSINDCLINGLDIRSNIIGYVTIEASQINSNLEVHVANGGVGIYRSNINVEKGIQIFSGSIWLDRNTFQVTDSIQLRTGKAKESDFIDKLSSTNHFIFQSNENISFTNNIFNYGVVDLIEMDLQNLYMTGNSFTNTVTLDRAIIKDRVVIYDNEFANGFSLSQTVLPELLVNIDWEQLKGNKLYINADQTAAETTSGFACHNCLPYFGKTNEELARKDRFRELITVYTKLYRINKEDGDISSANGAYAELQGLYTRRYEYVSQTEGGLENWFKWQLNQLLEYYVVYGTAPARALVVSFYIILAFSIFYFFFPSEWDTTSKKQLLEQFKLILDKKHKQIARPLMKTTGLFVLSFVNAFTLSINSLVTLGFGTIPTKGLARYVCIIQGFIGWFLLSLFTVALINQVIF
ncbi:MAG: hypothetical protein ABJG47_17980 [Ekhidna sp.]